MARKNTADRFVASYLSRNFHLVLIVLGISTWALFTGRLTGVSWATLAGTLVTTFRAGDAVVNWIHKDNPNFVDCDRSEQAGLYHPAAPQDVSLDNWVQTGDSNGIHR